MSNLLSLAIPRGVKIRELPLDTWYVNAMTAKLRGEAAVNPVIADTRIIDTKPGTVESFDALTQWQHSLRRLQRARGEKRRMDRKADALSWWFRGVTRTRTA